MLAVHAAGVSLALPKHESSRDSRLRLRASKLLHVRQAGDDGHHTHNWNVSIFHFVLQDSTEFRPWLPYAASRRLARHVASQVYISAAPQQRKNVDYFSRSGS